MSNGFDVFKDGWDGVACCFPASSVRSYASFFPAVSTLETPPCFHQKWSPPAEDILTGWLKKGQVWVCDRPTLCPRGRFFSPSGPHSSSKGCPPQLPSPLGSFHPFALRVLNKQSASWSHLRPSRHHTWKQSPSPVWGQWIRGKAATRAWFQLGCMFATSWACKQQAGRVGGCTLRHQSANGFGSVSS